MGSPTVNDRSVTGADSRNSYAHRRNRPRTDETVAVPDRLTRKPVSGTANRGLGVCRFWNGRSRTVNRLPDWYLDRLQQAKRGRQGAAIDSYGDALYWGVAAFSTAGIADTPDTGLGEFIGGLWIVIGSMLFFGAIVATVTTYFMRPMARPHKKIIDTIEQNLEQLDDLTLDELDLSKETVDTLIAHVERLKERQAKPASKTER